MAKCNANELSARINELDIDENLKISLMEDITDSISSDESEELSNLRAEIINKEAELKDLQEKYKARFMSAVESGKEEDKIDGEYEEVEVIDVKEI